MKPFLRSEADGADTIVWAASSPTAVTDVDSGDYLWDRRPRPIDLQFAGTQTSDTTVDELMAWLASEEGGSSCVAEET